MFMYLCFDTFVVVKKEEKKTEFCGLCTDWLGDWLKFVFITDTILCGRLV